MSTCCTEDEMLSPERINDSPWLFGFLSFSNSPVPLIVEPILVGSFSSYPISIKSLFTILGPFRGVEVPA